jgi:serine/threonine protein kinase
MAERVGQLLGNYQLLRLLGQGAFAEVYLAEHRYLEVPAAIKVLHVRLELDTQKYFFGEARTIAHLQHRHIVRILDFGFQDQTPFLVMEYAPNGTLRTRHPKGTRLPLEQIVQYVKQIASALDYAHQQRVIHRDVKPENMLLIANDEVVLSDFGLAVVQQSLDSLSTQSQAGTPIYMAPEQIQRKPCAASDQYAVGVLVYEWLCGEPPFRGSLFEVLIQHLHEPPPSLCARIPSLPQAVEDAVFGTLAKDPQARFDSVQDFAEVLQEVSDATQRLSVRVSLERLSPEQVPPPDILPAPRHEPLPQEQERSSSTTQPLVLTGQHTANTQEPLVVQVLPPAVQTPISSGQERVSVSRTNRQRLLRKVRAFWIAGVLEHSLHGAALLALGLEEQPDAVANPWQLVLQHPAGAPRSLPAATRITEVYDAAEGELLILGAPGSGKSTLLLELARDLLSRAEHDEQHPLPVVFNLSSWASQQQPLVDWLVEELNSTYQIPRKLGQAWVDADQILPLLDGLDEVAARDRTACIESINTYRGEHGLLPLVVCSRSADYLAQTARVRLSSAVAVQPLTEQQLFERYVERMLRHGGAGMRYTTEQTTHWLSWLARQLQQHNQTIFYIEHLQPDWLTGERMHRAYDRWALRFPAIFMGMLVCLAISVLLAPAAFNFSSLSALALSLASIIEFGGFIGWLLETGSTSQPPHENSRKARSGSWSRLVTQLRGGILFGLSYGLIFGLLALLIIWLSYGLISGLTQGLLSGLISGLAFGLIFGLSVGLASVLSFWLLAGLSFGLLAGLSGGLLSMLLIGKPVGITPTDELVWSWRSLGRSLFAKRHLFTTLRVMVFIGLIVGLASGLSYRLDTAGLGYPLDSWLSYGLLGGLAAGLSVGLSFWAELWVARRAGLWAELQAECWAHHWAECWAPGRTAQRGACLSATWRDTSAALACWFNSLELPRFP